MALLRCYLSFLKLTFFSHLLILIVHTVTLLRAKFVPVFRLTVEDAASLTRSIMGRFPRLSAALLF